MADNLQHSNQIVLHRAKNGWVARHANEYCHENFGGLPDNDSAMAVKELLKEVQRLRSDYAYAMGCLKERDTEVSRLREENDELKQESLDNYEQGQKKGIIDAGKGVILRERDALRLRVCELEVLCGKQRGRLESLKYDEHGIPFQYPNKKSVDELFTVTPATALEPVIAALKFYASNQQFVAGSIDFDDPGATANAALRSLGVAELAKTKDK